MVGTSQPHCLCALEAESVVTTTQLNQQKGGQSLPTLFLALLRRSAAAKAQPAEESLPIADQSSFERAGRSERTAQCP
jgi:hypothetical protein